MGREIIQRIEIRVLVETNKNSIDLSLVKGDDESGEEYSDRVEAALDEIFGEEEDDGSEED